MSELIYPEASWLDEIMEKMTGLNSLHSETISYYKKPLFIVFISKINLCRQGNQVTLNWATVGQLWKKAGHEKTNG